MLVHKPDRAEILFVYVMLSVAKNLKLKQCKRDSSFLGMTARKLTKRLKRIAGLSYNSSSNLLFKSNKKSYKAAFTRYGNISFWKVTKFLRTSESLTEVKANENTMLLLAFSKNASPPRRAGLFLK